MRRMKTSDQIHQLFSFANPFADRNLIGSNIRVIEAHLSETLADDLMLEQHQFDALVIFCYRNGIDFFSKSGQLIDAVNLKDFNYARTFATTFNENIRRYDDYLNLSIRVIEYKCFRKPITLNFWGIRDHQNHNDLEALMGQVHKRRLNVTYFEKYNPFFQTL